LLHTQRMAVVPATAREVIGTINTCTSSSNGGGGNPHSSIPQPIPLPTFSLFLLIPHTYPVPLPTIFLSPSINSINFLPNSLYYPPIFVPLPPTYYPLFLSLYSPLPYPPSTHLSSSPPLFSC